MTLWAPRSEWMEKWTRKWWKANELKWEINWRAWLTWENLFFRFLFPLFDLISQVEAGNAICVSNTWIFHEVHLHRCHSITNKLALCVIGFIRRRRQKCHTFACKKTQQQQNTLGTSNFHFCTSAAVFVQSTTWNDLLCTCVWTNLTLDDKFSLFSSNLRTAHTNFVPG